MSIPSVSIVVPTYQEHDNLQQLLPTLDRVCEQAGLNAEIVVVDDDSRDGTEQLCLEFSKNFSMQLVIRRDERGLASAVLRGLRESRGEICVVMDADFSHPPEIVPALVAAAQSPECDMAIGSRYVAGGSVAQDWSWFRRLNSRVATLLARGLTNASDPMAGLFAIRKSTLVRAGELRPLGYKVALELIVRCSCRNVVEVPIHFQDRAAGDSKMTLEQQWLYLRHLMRLYRSHYLSPRTATNAATKPLAPAAEPTRRVA
jgi:dolichol-phosphate mannosyltransferase